MRRIILFTVTHWTLSKRGQQLCPRSGRDVGFVFLIEARKCENRNVSCWKQKLFWIYTQLSGHCSQIEEQLFWPSAVVSRDGHVESCTCRLCRCLVPPLPKASPPPYTPPHLTCKFFPVVEIELIMTSKDMKNCFYMCLDIHWSLRIVKVFCQNSLSDTIVLLNKADEIIFRQESLDVLAFGSFPPPGTNLIW